METNRIKVPMYRGQKMNQKEYIEGFLAVYRERECVSYHILDEVGGAVRIKNEIDPSTLAIHFPDMIDSEGTRIFASLSKDGKGGDITELQADSGTCGSCMKKIEKSKAIAIYELGIIKEIDINNHECFPEREENYHLFGNLKYKKVTGIEE